jgi:hypothetical protein
MSRIVGLISEIATRPAVYLGYADVQLLQVFLIGYLQGLDECGGASAEGMVLQKFEEFIHRKYNTTEIANGKSWSYLIRERSDSDGAAFRTFCFLWSEFRERQVQPEGVLYPNKKRTL